MADVEHLLAVRNKLGEGPVWSVDEQALYWVDIERDRFFCLDPATGEVEVFEAGLPVGSLALRAAGGLALATKNGFAFWQGRGQPLRFIADPEAHKPQSRFNDGAVDRQGRFWAGTLGDGAANCLYRLDPDLALHTMETGVSISNGIGWSPDNKTMYFTDSPLQTIYAYDFDPATGAIAKRRVFVHDPGEPGVPDGLTVDRDGFVWSARWDGWALLRYDPDGRLERKIPMPVQYPTSCIFGGPALNELYITSAWSPLGERGKAAQPLAGDLFRLRTGSTGLPEPKFLG